MSVVVFNMFWELLIGPVVLSLDLLDACINVWMCLVNTRVEDGNLDWGFWRVDYIFFVHFFIALAPVAVVDAPVKLVVSSWSKQRHSGDAHASAECSSETVSSSKNRIPL